MHSHVYLRPSFEKPPDSRTKEASECYKEQALCPGPVDKATFLGAEEERAEGRQSGERGKAKMFIQKVIIVPPIIVSRTHDAGAEFCSGCLYAWVINFAWIVFPEV
jgi:hypothetical protein